MAEDERGLSGWWAKWEDALFEKLLLALVLGLVTLLAGYLLNGALQRQASHEAFANEIAKARVQATATVWAALYRRDLQLQQESDELTPRLAGARLVAPGSTPPEAFLSREADIARAQRPELARVESVLANARFWLTTDFYARASAYLGLQQRLVSDLSHLRPGALTAGVGAVDADAARIRSERSDVLDVVKQLGN